MPTNVACQAQRCSHLGDQGFADGPFESGVCDALFTASTLPWGWSLRNSFANMVLPGLLAVPEIPRVDFAPAALLDFPDWVPISPSCLRPSLMTVWLIFPFIPAAVHA